MTDERYDLGFLAYRIRSELEWSHTSKLFPPAKPKYLLPGARVWLYRDGRFFWSYRIDDIVHREQRITPDEDRGPGWVLIVSDGRPARKRADRIPGFSEWHQAPFRYLTPGAREFVNVSVSRSRRRKVPSDAIAGSGSEVEVRKVPWGEPRTDYGYVMITEAQVITATRKEADLLDRYRASLGRRGRDLVPRRIRPSGRAGTSRIEADAFDERRHLLIEAKASAQRNDIRMAIGQLKDYARFLGHPRLAVLLPERPVKDLQDLLAHEEIAAIWATGARFVDNASGDFTLDKRS